MWGSQSARIARRLSVAAPLAVGGVSCFWPTATPTTRCEEPAPAAADVSRLKRRKNTVQQLSVLRSDENEIMLRWERDEDGWRELPARAWPAVQPDEEALVVITAAAVEQDCLELALMTESSSKKSSCQELLFQMATSMVFYNVDANAGLQIFKDLAATGHVDAMVACGIILVEGLGVPAQEEQAIEWLEKAVAAGSLQACYELGTVYYTGIDGVVEEDPVKAFELFEKAAKSNHVGALYMVADCLLEGEGTAVSVADAVPLLYEAAEQGHRYSRQKIRELLRSKRYKQQTG